MLSEVQFDLDYPNSNCKDDAQNLYCIDGQLKTIPGACPIVYGEFDHRFGAYPTQPEAAVGAIPLDGAQGVEVGLAAFGRRTALDVENTTCYPMQTVLFESDFLNYAIDGDDNHRVSIRPAISRAVGPAANLAVPVRIILAGGVTDAGGNNVDPNENNTGGFTFIDPTLIAPGDTVAYRVAWNYTTQSGATAGFSGINQMAVAVRVIGFPQC